MMTSIESRISESSLESLLFGVEHIILTNKSYNREVITMNDLEGARLGLLVGSVPTLAMMIASALLTRINVGAKIEACFQNFAAGLILAAVACELFPLMLKKTSETNSLVGITAGFVVGLGMIYGVEYFVEYFENVDTTTPKNSSLPHRTYPKEISIGDNLMGIEDEQGVRRSSFSTRKSGDWESEPLQRAAKAIAVSTHRQHIHHHLVEVSESIAMMEERSQALQSGRMSVVAAEEAAECIDEEIHRVQYKLDHCRRLVQGSETALLAMWDPSSSGDAVDHLVATQTPLIAEQQRMQQMSTRLHNLHNCAEHLLEHLAAPQIDEAALREIHAHMDDMDAQINGFHASVEHVAAKWRRTRSLPATHLGDTLPVSLVVPVTIDCFVDGFLIGVSVALSPKAGVILAVANCLEMAFLGMAYATRLVKCTGSSGWARFTGMFAPPVLMLLSAGLGAQLGTVAESIPALFIAFVAFGVVALLYLVCNELLIEARAAQGEEERWWVSITIFAGIYVVVLMTTHIE